MKRYYFHHRSRERYISDKEGSIHLRLEDALREAYESAREIMRSQLSAGKLDLAQEIEIFEDTGILMATIAFSEAASPDPPLQANRLCKNPVRINPHQ